MRFTVTPDILEYRDIAEEDPAEVEASKYDLAFIKLDGNIGVFGEWRGSRNGNNGHHQTFRRNARELPRRGRWREQRKSDQRRSN